MCAIPHKSTLLIMLALHTEEESKEAIVCRLIKRRISPKTSQLTELANHNPHVLLTPFSDAIVLPPIHPQTTQCLFQNTPSPSQAVAAANPSATSSPYPPSPTALPIQRPTPPPLLSPSASPTHSQTNATTAAKPPAQSSQLGSQFRSMPPLPPLPLPLPRKPNLNAGGQAAPSSLAPHTRTKRPKDPRQTW